MPTKQGDLALLDDPVAQRLLQSTIPAHVAYIWRDGSPRVIPIGFHWNGAEIELGTPPDSPKMAVLRDGVKVAVTIDSDTMPFKVLLIRGAVRTDRLNRATFHRFFAERFFLGRFGLFVDERVPAVIVALEICRSSFAAQITVNALIIDVESALCVLGIFVCCVGHGAPRETEVEG